MQLNVRRLVPGALLAAALTAAGAAHAQMRGGSPAGGMGGMQQQTPQPGMTPGMQPGMNATQNSEQMNFIGNMRRNMKAETELSKIAEKNSQNDGVKKFAEQIINENRQAGTELNSRMSADGMNQGMMASPEIPKETKKAEKDMKKMSGPQFDANYLGQLNAYLKNDQQLTQQAAASNDMQSMQDTVMRLRSQADQREQQLAQLAKAENFKMQ
jgi:predicted outer membrane protein